MHDDVAPQMGQLLQLPEREFFVATNDILASCSPNGLAMTVIAYPNLKSLVKTAMVFAQTYKDKSVPTNLDAFIQMTMRHQEQASDEVAKCRLGWFVCAGCVLRASEIATNNPRYQSLVVPIWTRLALGAGILWRVLRSNRLWADAETQEFSFIRTEEEGIRYCLWTMAPQYLHGSDEFLNFASSKGVHW